MSYPKQIHRENLDTSINTLIDKLQEIPESDKIECLGYILLSITTSVFFKLKGSAYSRFMSILGVMENSSREFHRRIVLPHEHTQISKNGDLKALERYPYVRD